MFLIFVIRRLPFGQSSLFTFLLNMAETADENLLLQDEPGSISTQTREGGTAKDKAPQDLLDTFQLFKLYMDGKMENLESKLVREQDAISKKIKEDVSIKFRHEGNRI